jgi:hypothetical protein
MFSQFRTAVEQLAQQPRRPTSLDALSTSPQHDHSGSADSQGIMSSLSSGQLADSAITNLRKSLVAQRSSSPKTAITTPDQFKPRSKLEERLRASLSFTIGEDSNSTTPDLSARATPLPPPKSPASTMLPDSPIGSPDPEARVVSHLPEDVATAPRDIQPLAQPTPVRADAERLLVAETLEAVVDDLEHRYTEADIPLPESPVVELIKESIPDHAAVSDTNISGVDVEALRQQLKLFKERFAGMPFVL